MHLSHKAMKLSTNAREGMSRWEETQHGDVTRASGRETISSAIRKVRIIHAGAQ